MSTRRRGGAWRDPRIWLGLAISAVTIWYSLRGVDFRELGRTLARANLWVLIVPSVITHLWSFWVRALRWRHLTEPVAPIERGPLFRAIAVGFMANNIFPLRLGEVVRAWYLARETGASSSALFGTVIAERLIDIAFILALAAVLFAVSGNAMGLDAVTVLPVLALAALLPFAGVAVLRIWPEPTIRLGARLGDRFLSEGWGERIAQELRRLAEGLGALRGGRHLWWIAFHTVVLWMVAAVVPLWLSFESLHLDLGSPARTLLALYTVLVFIGFAVAVPSAPGFFGPYHFACWLALRPFGVSKEQAIAMGTLAHAVFWVTATGLGLLVLRFGRTRLEDAREAAEAPTAGKDPLQDRR